MSEEDARAAQEFERQTRSLSAVWEGFELRATREILPGLTLMLQALQGDSEAVGKLNVVLEEAKDDYWLGLGTVVDSVAKKVWSFEQTVARFTWTALFPPAALIQGVRELEDAIRKAEHSIHGSGLADTIIEFLVPAYNEAISLANKFGDAVENEGRRSEQASKRAVEADAMRLMQTIAGRRAGAAIEAVWETAKGFAALGEWDFWGAAQHFMSATEFGLVAGGVGTARGAGGSAAGGARATPKAASVPTASGEPVSLAPGAAGAVAGGGMVVVLNIDSREFARAVVPAISRHVQSEGGRLVASHALRPVSAGA